MKTLLKLICIIVLTLSVNSCAREWPINSYDPVYSDENYQIEEFNAASQLKLKLQTGWGFSNNYYLHRHRQNYSFFHNHFNCNRLYRYGWQSSRNYCMNWECGYYFGYSYNNIWNQYPYYGNWNTNYWWNYQSNYPYYSHVYRPRTQWLGNVYGRNAVYGGRLQTYRYQALPNTNRKISKRRIPKPPKTTTPVIKNKSVINIEPITRKRRVINTKSPVKTKPTQSRTAPPSTRSRKTVPLNQYRTVPPSTRKTVPSNQYRTVPPSTRKTVPSNQTRKTLPSTRSITKQTPTRTAPPSTRTKSPTHVKTSKKRGGQ